MMTPCHSKLWAHQLTRRCPPDSPELFAGTVASARVDLRAVEARLESHAKVEELFAVKWRIV